MISTTTGSVEGKRIVAYKGIVFGEVISGVNFLRDFSAGLTNFFGGRSSSYEEELQQARDAAISEMEQRAAARGAKAVIGVDIDYEILGTGNNMLMVSATFSAGAPIPMKKNCSRHGTLPFPKWSSAPQHAAPTRSSAWTSTMKFWAPETICSWSAHRVRRSSANK